MAATEDFINKFYTLLDGESPQAAKEFSEMFTEDAEFVTPVGTVKSRPNIKSQREDFWKSYPGLAHQPLRIYVSPKSPLEIVVINDFRYKAKDTAQVSYTAAEYNLVESDGSYLIQKLELFMDPTVLGWKRWHESFDG
ncbi:hypothetical protein BDV18DRAFT_156210 [Aspergillus unguis]